MPPTLTHDQARRLYDRLGAGQDTQAPYETPALDLLISHAALSTATTVAEFGAGTGRLAARLLTHELPANASYWAFDLSSRMVQLAGERLAAFGPRARVSQTDGSIRLPLPPRSVDRVLCTYVLDLLGEADIQAFVAEAHRVLQPGGLLGIASLTDAYTAGARVLQRLWKALYTLHPGLVGGCRPVDLAPYFRGDAWAPVFAGRTTRFGMPSQVLVVQSRSGAVASNRPV